MINMFTSWWSRTPSIMLGLSPSLCTDTWHNPEQTQHIRIVVSLYIFREFFKKDTLYWILMDMYRLTRALTKDLLWPRVSSLSLHHSAPVLAGSVLMSQALKQLLPSHQNWPLSSSRLTRSNEYLLWLNIMTKNQKYQRLELVCLLLSLTDLVTEMSKHVSAVVVVVVLVMPQHLT